jgi:hypothetical protein
MGSSFKVKLPASASSLRSVARSRRFLCRTAPQHMTGMAVSRAQPQQRRGGGDVRQYDQRPNQQRAREYPATAVQPARQSPTRPAPTQQGSDYQPGVCFSLRDKGVCTGNKPKCGPYSHNAVMTSQVPRGGGKPWNRSNHGGSDGGDRGERRARFTGFASTVNLRRSCGGRAGHGPVPESTPGRRSYVAAPRRSAQLDRDLDSPRGDR